MNRLQKKTIKAIHNNAKAGLKPDDIEGEQPEKEGRNGI